MALILSYPKKIIIVLLPVLHIVFAYFILIRPCMKMAQTNEHNYQLLSKQLTHLKVRCQQLQRTNQYDTCAHDNLVKSHKVMLVQLLRNVGGETALVQRFSREDGAYQVNVTTDYFSLIKLLSQCHALKITITNIVIKPLAKTQYLLCYLQVVL